MAGPDVLTSPAPGAAATHDHAHHRGNALISAARSALENKGEQWTAMRADMFEALAGFGRPASAYDVAERLTQARGRRVAANSVYRILDLFVANNLAHRVESANAYVVNPHPGCVHDCIFLVCSGCGAVHHLDDDRVSARVRAAAAGTGFRTERPVIEVRGRCAACLEKAGNGSTPPDV